MERRITGRRLANKLHRANSRPGSPLNLLSKNTMRRLRGRFLTSILLILLLGELVNLICV